MLIEETYSSCVILVIIFFIQSFEMSYQTLLWHKKKGECVVVCPSPLFNAYFILYLHGRYWKWSLEWKNRPVEESINECLSTWLLLDYHLAYRSYQTSSKLHVNFWNHTVAALRMWVGHIFEWHWVVTI